MTNESICLDERFSTTKLVFRKHLASAATSLSNEGDKSWPMESDIKTEGGLRTKGFLKQDVLNKPLITVITVVFDGAQRLEDTIRSVVNQTYENVEYIVIDGGSTDGTLEIVRKFGEVIDYWVSGPDKGIYDAMNRGLSVASGEWINFMNAGDAFCSRESIANTVKEFSEALVYYSDAVFYLEHAGNCYYRKVPCDARRHQFIHQSCIYSKQLHSMYGQYMVAAGVTASDYLFFKGVPLQYWRKTKTTISKYHVGDNISSGRRHDEQVYGADLFFGSRSISKTIAVYWLENVKRFVRKIERSLFSRDLYLTRVEKYSKMHRDEFWQDFLRDQDGETPRSIE